MAEAMRRRFALFLSWCLTGIGKDLQQLLASLWEWSLNGVRRRRVARERARFWDEMREGEREADTRSRR
jgi:hypothetical protein